MKFAYSILLLYIALLHNSAIAAESEKSSSEALNQLDSIKNQLRIIKSEVLGKCEIEKLQWQLEVLQNWFKDEPLVNGFQDISKYIFPQWQVVQKRFDGSVDFAKNWLQYEQGFGTASGEYFMGLQKLHELTSLSQKSYELLIILGFQNKTIGYAHYDNFKIDGPNEKYALAELGAYQGTVGDFMRKAVQRPFRTAENDKLVKAIKGGWWYKYSTDK